jgi:hypothetical protein
MHLLCSAALAARIVCALDNAQYFCATGTQRVAGVAAPVCRTGQGIVLVALLG